MQSFKFEPLEVKATPILPLPLHTLSCFPTDTHFLDASGLLTSTVHSPQPSDTWICRLYVRCLGPHSVSDMAWSLIQEEMPGPLEDAGRQRFSLCSPALLPAFSLRRSSGQVVWARPSTCNSSAAFAMPCNTPWGENTSCGCRGWSSRLGQE